MNRRALAIALVLALVGAALLLLYLRRYEREMSGGEPVQLLMVVKPIARGAVLKDDMLAVRAVPAAYVEDRAVKAGERAKILGLASSVALSPQQTLLWTDLAITTEDRDLSALIQPGKRGVTVRAAVGADDTRANALIRPGDYVDVIATMAPKDPAEERTSTVLLQRVLVLAVGQETQASSAPDPKGRQSAAAARDKLLTISLNLQEAQLLALALERGRISVAVRSPEDPWTQNDVPDVKASALLDVKTRAELQRGVRPQAPVKIQATGIR
jgi:pilus assembly protein CpaB